MRKLSRIRTVGIFFAVTGVIALIGTVFSSRATLKKAEGQVASVNLEVTGYGRRMHSTTTFQLAGSSERFSVSEKGDANSFTGRINTGDTIRLYKTTFLHFLNGTFVRGNTLRVEKGGIALYDNIKELRIMGAILLVVFGGLAALGAALYRMEASKIRRYRKDRSGLSDDNNTGMTT
jgi:hypothetical protein